MLRTGFMTSKGKLVHSILHPQPINMRLMQDAYKFVAVLTVISFIGFGYTAYLLVGLTVVRGL